MKRKILWLIVSGLMALSLVMTACWPATTQAPPPTQAPTKPTPVTPSSPSPTAPTAEKPQKEAVKPATSTTPRYGGRLNLYRTTDQLHFDATASTGQTNGASQDIVNEPLWEGDWARGPAGGYGTNEISFTEDNDLWDIKTGIIAESTKWTYDFGKNEGTIVYQIRQGIRWALNPNSEASRLVGGRELTTDDVVAHMKRMITDTAAYVYSAQTEMRTANISKTGPREITVKLPVDALLTAITRFGQAKVAPPEVIQKYGNTRDWKTSVGTGAFMVTDYVPGSQIVYTRNPNFWMKDPVGPGKGNQLPYLDGVRFLIIPDTSTWQAALRTGKIDVMGYGQGFGFDDAAKMRQQVPALKEVASGRVAAPWTPIRTDKAPFTDVRVRRALFMAIDFQTILKNLYPGQDQQINTWPWPKTKGYEEMYLGLDDPDMPASVKELFTYNPDKAKQLLKEAGFPNGFKTTVLVSTATSIVDYYSVVKDYFAKVGIDLTLDVKDSSTLNTILLNRQQEALEGAGTHNPLAIWYTATMFSDAALQNAAQIKDPYINDTVVKIRRTLLTDGAKPAMKMWREMMKYVLDQAYNIPGVSTSATRFWWPWVKNYSGETGMSYYVFNFPQFVWYDQELKKSMGY